MKRRTILPCCHLWVYFYWKKLTYTLLACWFTSFSLLGTRAAGAMPRRQTHMRVRDARVSVLYFFAQTLFELYTITCLSDHMYKTEDEEHRKKRKSNDRGDTRTLFNLIIYRRRWNEGTVRCKEAVWHDISNRLVSEAALRAVVHPLWAYSVARGEFPIIITSLKWKAGRRKQRYHWSPAIPLGTRVLLHAVTKIKSGQGTEMKARNERGSIMWYSH
jgi:hypothetical protein